MSDFFKTASRTPDQRYRRRRPLRRVDNGFATSHPIEIRVGNRFSEKYHDSMQATGDWNTSAFQGLVQQAVKSRSDPNDPLIIVVNGWAEWLDPMFATVIHDFGISPGDTNYSVQRGDRLDQPHKCSSRRSSTPWTFIIDQMNAPSSYYWSVREEPPPPQELESVDDFVFRMGGWFCGHGAYKPDDRVAVAILFVKPSDLTNALVMRAFTKLYLEPSQHLPDMNEAGLVWLFLQLYNFFSDWTNITRLIEVELSRAEADSEGRNIPVKLRTRSMHKQVDRIFDLGQYLSFHSRSLKKLAKTKSDVPQQDQDDPVWDELDDAIDGLDQDQGFLDSLKERFNNLIELEFNIDNATQSDNGRFLSILGTLFLPVSFLASVFSLSSVNWSALLFLYIAIPVVIISSLFTLFTPFVTAEYRAMQYPSRRTPLVVQKKNFTMLGDETPSSASVPRSTPPRNPRRYDEKQEPFSSRQHRRHSSSRARDGDDRGGGRSRSRSRSRQRDSRRRSP